MREIRFRTWVHYWVRQHTCHYSAVAWSLFGPPAGYVAVCDDCDWTASA